MIDRCPIHTPIYCERLKPNRELIPEIAPVNYELILRRGKKVVPAPPNVDEVVDEWHQWAIARSTRKPRRASVNKWFREAFYEIEGLREKCQEHVDKHPK